MIISLQERLRGHAYSTNTAGPAATEKSPVVQVASLESGVTEAVPFTLTEFYRAVLPDGGRYVLYQNKQHTYHNTLSALAKDTERRLNTQGLYFATAAYGEQKNRTGENVRALRAHRVDIDAGDLKFAKHPDGAYQTQRDALVALVAAVKAGLPSPSLIVSSGEGLHCYWALDDDVLPATWRPVALMLNAAGKALGLKIDSGCTADLARVLRPLGAVHKNGTKVKLLKNTGLTYSNDVLMEQFTKLAPEQDTFSIAVASAPKFKSVNDDILDVKGPPASLARVAENCTAVAEMRDKQGNVPEPFWRAVIGVAKYCEDGPRLAHEWSAGYEGYEPNEVEGRIDRWETPPTTCTFFASMHDGCKTCKYRGKITTPKQLGYAVADSGAAIAAPAHVVALNGRYALVRRGDSVAILDEHSVIETPDGTRACASYLSVAAFKVLRAGEFGPPSTVGGAPVPIAASWLAHPMRRQYANGVVFLPEGDAPKGTYNLWQGFGTAPAFGDVTPWLDLLADLIPDEAVRRYVLQWLAYKVQNPGAVPGTILLLTGRKGTGKNSLVEPIVRIFGSHGRVFDDAEQVAGRFTGHLQGVAFAVLDEALFAGDPRQNDRIKARVTATTVTYESKGVDPVAGVNRCAYVSLSNHLHVWDATVDERRAVVVECGDGLTGKRGFWQRYYGWLDGQGPSALLHHLQSLDLSGFEPRDIPRSGALGRQVALTAMRDPAVAWWYATLDEGVLTLRSGLRVAIPPDQVFEVCKSDLRESFEAHGARRGDWSRALSKLKQWVGEGGMVECRPGSGGLRQRVLRLPDLKTLRAHMSTVEQVSFDAGLDEPSEAGGL